MPKLYRFLIAALVAALLGTVCAASAQPANILSAEDCDSRLHCVEVSAELLEQGSIAFTSRSHYTILPAEGSEPPPANDDPRWELSERMWFYNSEIRENWKGDRWLKVYLEVDESLYGKTVALRSFIMGAARIWLNDEEVLVSGNPSGQYAVYERGEVRPWMPVTFSDEPVQQLMIYHANLDYEKISRSMWGIGTSIWINELKRDRDAAAEQHRFFSALQWGVSSFCLMFGLLHLFLWFYNRRLIFNLWFALVCLLYAVTTWIQQEFFFYDDVILMIRKQYVMQALITVGFGFLGLFLYSVIRTKPPLYFKIFFGVIVVVAFVHTVIYNLNFVTLSLGLAMGVMLVFIAIRVLRSGVESVWLLGAGILVYITSIFTSVGFEMAGTQVSSAGLSVHHLPYIGFGIAIIAMSLFQSRHIASLNLNLTKRLHEVKRLSKVNLQQERSLRDAAVEKARLETENERKSAELEQARQLQLSLIPSEIPPLEGYRMQACMHTATEVGGDYYDIVPVKDDRFIWALGDATGHGAEAGFLAAMTKTLVQALTPHFAADEALRRISAELRKVGLKKKFMCLALLEISGDKIKWCSAGIPPVIICRAATGKTELLESKGMPLGTVTGYKYIQREATLQPGDLLLAATDGMMEQMNESRTQFGIEGITKALEKCADKEPEEVITCLLEEIKTWRGEMHQQDDITMVCVRRGIFDVG